MYSLLANARTLRVNSTDAERCLWYYLRNRRMSGYRFRRQMPLGHYIVDFVCLRARLIVEIDRAGHARYFTTMQMLLITLQLGGSGATMPPPAAEIARHVIDAFMAKEYERAAELQLQFALFPARWMHRGLAPAMKAAMNLIGVPAGEPHPPYARLSGEETAAMAALLRSTVLARRLAATAAA